MERKTESTQDKDGKAGNPRPQDGSGRSGRGSASALDAWKKLEQDRHSRTARDDESPGR